MWISATVSNDSTSPGVDQSRLDQSGFSPVQCKKFLDRDRTSPQFCWTRTGLAWTSPALCPGLGYISHCIGLLMGEIYLDGTEYTDRTVIISPRAGIQR